MNIDSLRGRRTYLTCAVGLGLLVCHWTGWLSLPTEVYQGLLFLALWYLRTAVADVSGQNPPSQTKGTS